MALHTHLHVCNVYLCADFHLHLCVCMWKTGQSWKALIRADLHFYLWCMVSQWTRTYQGGLLTSEPQKAWTCFQLPNTRTTDVSHHAQLLSHIIWDSSSCSHESTLLSALPRPININFYTNVGKTWPKWMSFKCRFKTEIKTMISQKILSVVSRKESIILDYLNEYSIWVHNIFLQAAETHLM